MVSNEPLAQLSGSAAYHAAPAVALDADFDTRWAAWLARGRAHEQQARRTFILGAGVLAMGATIIYVFLRS